MGFGLGEVKRLVARLRGEARVQPREVARVEPARVEPGEGGKAADRVPPGAIRGGKQRNV